MLKTLKFVDFWSFILSSSYTIPFSFVAWVKFPLPTLRRVEKVWLRRKLMLEKTRKAYFLSFWRCLNFLIFWRISEATRQNIFYACNADQSDSKTSVGLWSLRSHCKAMFTFRSESDSKWQNTVVLFINKTLYVYECKLGT